MTIVYFLIALGLLVFIHEFGHFIMAKSQGIGVEVFSLGFGPKLFSFKKKETDYRISALPFGGYVKLHGEEGGEAPVQDEKSYAERPLRQRVRVVFAGPLMNLLLALAIMPVAFMIGRMEPVYLQQKPVVMSVLKGSPAEKIGLQKGDEITKINQTEIGDWRELVDFVLLHGNEEVNLEVKRGGELLTPRVKLEKSPETHTGFLGIEPAYFIGNEPILDEVAPGSAAAESGLKAGDEILQIDQTPVQSWTEMSERVSASEGKKLAITVRRGGEIINVFLVPRYDEGMKKWLMGVRKSIEKRGEAFVKRKYPFFEAIVRGTRENIKLGELTFSVLGRLVTFNLSYKTLGGPIRIAQASAIAAKAGISEFIYFLGFLSLQLGLLNLLPIPALDGGHLLFFGMEGISRRPVPIRVRQIIEQTGFFLLIFLMLLITMNDVESVWGVHQILEKIKNIF